METRKEPRQRSGRGGEFWGEWEVLSRCGGGDPSERSDGFGLTLFDKLGSDRRTEILLRFTTVRGTVDEVVLLRSQSGVLLGNSIYNY